MLYHQIQTDHYVSFLSVEAKGASINRTEQAENQLDSVSALYMIYVHYAYSCNGSNVKPTPVAHLDKKEGESTGILDNVGMKYLVMSTRRL